jgi:hypothetical protein
MTSFALTKNKLTPCITIIMDVRAISCIASTIPHPLPSIQCISGFFYLQDAIQLRASNLDIGRPWLNRYKIVEN